MTVDIGTIRTALSDGLNAIDGLRAAATVPDAVNVPQAVIVRKNIDYDLVFTHGAHTFHFTVTVYAGRTASDRGQQKLDDLANPSGASSVKAALEADSVATAAGVQYVRVTGCSEVQLATIGAIEYLSEEFTVEAVA